MQPEYACRSFRRGGYWKEEEKGVRGRVREREAERDEGLGDFRDFPEVGLLGPPAVLGGRSPREVAHKPSAISPSARGVTPPKCAKAERGSGPAGKGLTKSLDGTANASLRRHSLHTQKEMIMIGGDGDDKAERDDKER